MQKLDWYRKGVKMVKDAQSCLSFQTFGSLKHRLHNMRAISGDPGSQVLIVILDAHIKILADCANGV